MPIYIYLNYIRDTLLDMKICLQNEVDHIQSWTNPETFRSNFRIWQSRNPFSSSVQNGNGQKFLWLPEEGNKVWPPAFDIKKTPTALLPTLASRRKQVPSFPSQIRGVYFNPWKSLSDTLTLVEGKWSVAFAKLDSVCAWNNFHKISMSYF